MFGRRDAEDAEASFVRPQRRRRNRGAFVPPQRRRGHRGRSIRPQSRRGNRGQFCSATEAQRTQRPVLSGHRGAEATERSLGKPQSALATGCLQSAQRPVRLGCRLSRCGLYGSSLRLLAVPWLKTLSPVRSAARSSSLFPPSPSRLGRNLSLARVCGQPSVPSALCRNEHSRFLCISAARKEALCPL